MRSLLRSSGGWTYQDYIKSGPRQPMRCQASTGRAAREFRSQDEVLEYARTEFKREVGPERADGTVRLAYCGLLIALEEEAANEMELVRSQQENMTWLDVLNRETAAVGGSLQPDDVTVEVYGRQLGTRHTWDLTVLDALTAEANSICQAMWDLDNPRSSPDPAQPSGEATVPPPNPVQDPEGIVPPLHPTQDPEGELRRPKWPGVSSQAGADVAAGHADVAGGGEAVQRHVNADVAAGHADVAGGGEAVQGQLNADVVAGRADVASGGEAVQQEMNGDLAAGRADVAAPQADVAGVGGAVQRQVNAAQAVIAVNCVLFDRHGYRRMDRHGDPRDAVFSQVMERGSGTPAALAILYMEVCQRMGVPMAAHLLEEGRYLVLWPEQQPLMANGCTFAVDSYSNGDLISAAEVAELFELEAGLRPSGRREILAALLGSLQATHWARAVGCPAEPALCVPLSVETANSGQIGPLRGFDMDRAIASAERRCFLLPDYSDVKLELILLLYFTGRYGEASDGLGDYYKMEGARTKDPSVEAFRHKLSLLLRVNYKPTRYR